MVLKDLNPAFSTLSYHLANYVKATSLSFVSPQVILLDPKLPQIWRSGKFNTKRKLQNLVFPEGIRYNRENDNYRTTRTNFLFSIIACLSEEYVEKKWGFH